MDDTKYWVAFNRIASLLGAPVLSDLERHFGSLEDAWQADASELAAAGLDQRQGRQIDRSSSDWAISPDAVEMEQSSAARDRRVSPGTTLAILPRLKTDLRAPSRPIHVRGTLARGG